MWRLRDEWRAIPADVRGSARADVEALNARIRDLRRVIDAGERKLRKARNKAQRAETGSRRQRKLYRDVDRADRAHGVEVHRLGELERRRDRIIRRARR